MVKIKTNNKHVPFEELDVTESEAKKLVETGNYVYVNEVVIEETIEEPVEESKEE